MGLGIGSVVVDVVVARAAGTRVVDVAVREVPDEHATMRIATATTTTTAVSRERTGAS